jgi:YVTN family beta-propeller protein
MGNVSHTLDLGNGSLSDGNYLPPTCGGYDALVVSPVVNQLFVSCEGAAAVVVFNATSGSQVAYLDVGQDPLGMVFDSFNQEIYVADSGSNNVSVLSTANDTVFAAIPVGSSPAAIVYDNSSQLLYVSDTSSGNLSEISPQTNTIVGNVVLNSSSEPGAIAYDPSNQDVYVAQTGTNSLGIVSTRNGSLVSTLRLNGEPTAVTYDSENQDVYVTLSISTQNSNSVCVVSGLTQRVVDEVAVGFEPSAVVWDPVSGEVYVSNAGSDNVSVLNGTTQDVVGAIGVDLQPQAMAMESDSGYLFVADYYSSNVAVVNLTEMEVIGFLASDTGPVSIAVDNSTGNAYITNWYTGTLSEVDSESGSLLSSEFLWPSLQGLAVNDSSGDAYASCEACSAVLAVNSSGRPVHSIRVGAQPEGLAIDTSGGRVYSANWESNNVSVIDANTDAVTGTISLAGGSLGGGGPVGVAFDESSADLYVAVHGNLNFNPGNVSIINAATNEIVGAITDWGGPGPSDLLIDTAANALYVTDDYANVVWVFNLSTDNLISVVPVGQAPEGIALDPLNGYLYVSNSGSQNVSVVNATTDAVVGSITVGEMPTGIAFDYSSGDILVANYLSSTISIISGPMDRVATFTESGLPSGTSWWVNVTGQASQVSTGATIGMNLSEGTYPYTIATSNKEFEASSGTLVMNGTTAFVNVTFTEATFGVMSTETGLPAGATWYLNVTGQPSVPSIAQTAMIDLPNGTYAYGLATGDNQYQPIPATGGFTVEGTAVFEYFKFSPVVFGLNFTETPLPQGTNWSIELVGSASAIILESSLGSASPVTETRWSDGASTIQFYVSNGSYTYTASASGHPNISGQLSVRGEILAPVTVTFPSSSMSSVGLPTLDYLIIGVVVAAFVIVVVAILVRHRGRTPPAPLASSPQPGRGSPPTPP